MVVHRRPGDGQQVPGGPHRLGPDAQGRLPALQGAARLRPALPERVRLPGPVDRGRRRARARAQLEARDRGVRARGVRPPLPRGRRTVLGGPDARQPAARTVDGLGQRLLHVQRHEHRVHLEVPEDRQRPRLALHGTPLDRVVPALRHVALAARADPGRRLPGPRRPVAQRALPAPRPAGPVGRHLDDDALDAAGERRRGRQPGGRLRAARERRVGRGAAVPRRHIRRARQGLGARRPALSRAVRRPEAGLGGRAPRDPVGRRDDGPGHRCRPHRPGRRRRGLRALEGARPARADAGRRVRPVLRRLRVAARRLDDRVGRPDHRRARREGHPRRVDPLHARLPALLALRHAAHLPALRRLVHLGRGDPPEAARGERQGAVGARVHGEAHGRLAAQHGRLEHLAAPLLRAAAAVLSVLMRSSERRRLEARARRARDGGLRRARGAAPPVGRPCADHVRVVRRGRDARARGRGRLARRRHRPVLDARVGEPRVDQGGVRDRRRARADARRPARPQLLGDVVPRRLGDGDARADPALVLLAVLHVGRARRHLAVQARARLREDARRARAARCTAPGGT